MRKNNASQNQNQANQNKNWANQNQNRASQNQNRANQNQNRANQNRANQNQNRAGNVGSTKIQTPKKVTKSQLQYHVFKNIRVYLLYDDITILLAYKII